MNGELALKGLNFTISYCIVTDLVLTAHVACFHLC